MTSYSESVVYVAANCFGYGFAFLLLAALNRRVRGPFSFATVFSAFYGLALAINQIWYKLVIGSPHALDLYSLCVLFAAWWMFLAGAIIVSPRYTLTVRQCAPVSRVNAVAVLWFLVAANTVYSIVQGYKQGTWAALLSTHGQSPLGALVERRVDRGADGSGVGWYFEAWHNAYLLYIPLVLYLLRLKLVGRKTVALVFLFAVVNSVAGVSRVHLLMVLTVGFATWVQLFTPSTRDILRKSGLVLAIAMTFFLALQIAIDQKSSDISRQEVGNSGTVLDQFITYSVGPLTNYQEILRGGYYQYNPKEAFYSLQPAYYFLDKLGVIDGSDYPIGYREYVLAPFPSNVYTFLDSFTLDFGVFGGLAGAMITGSWVCLAYRLLRTRVSYFGLVNYALSFYGCVIAVLANIFTTHMFVLHLLLAMIVHLAIGGFTSRAPKNRAARVSPRSPFAQGFCSDVRGIRPCATRSKL